MRVCLCCYLSYPTCKLHFMRRSLARLDLPYFPHYPIKCMILGENIIEHKLCAFIFSATFFFCTISHSKKNSAKYHKCNVLLAVHHSISV
jgi:hypothetical protein